MNESRKALLSSLVHSVYEGTMDRRAFVRRAAMLGIAPAVAGTVFTTYRAGSASAAGLATSRTLHAAGQDNATPVPGGTFNFARNEDSVTFDPVATFYNADIWLIQNVYEQLLRVAPDGVTLEPSLATAFEVTADGLTYTFHLRPGVTFHDGSAMKASDVKFSMERAKNDPNNIWTFTMTAVKEITAPDDGTIVVTLNQPWAPFLADIAMFNCSIMPEAWVGADEAKLVNSMMGTGPFAFDSMEKANFVKLTKNAAYWDIGLPYLDEIMVTYVPDDNNRILQIQGGEIHGLTGVPTSRVDELSTDSNLQVAQFPSTFSQYIVFNHSVAPLDDLNVRMALQYATDKQAIIQVALFGNGTEATTFMPKGSLFWNDQLPGFPFNLDTAKEYMAKSKSPTGFQIEFQYQAGDAEREQVAAAVKDMWSAIGVDVQIAPTELSTFNDNFAKGNFQTFCTYWTNDIIDPDELVAFAIEPDTSNAFHTGWTNAEAVDLASKGRAELDPDKRKAIYFRIQEIFNEDSVMGLLYHKPFINVLTTKVHGFLQAPTGQWVWKGTWIEQ